MPIKDDTKNAAVIAFVNDIRQRIDTGFDYVQNEPGLTRAEKAQLNMEFHHQYVRNDTLMTEATRMFQPVSPPPGP